ncbi:hypothetical protein ACX80U_12075 [Arthrobacter sp. TmT3-37]
MRKDLRLLNAGFRKLRNDRGVVEDLERRLRRIASVAGPGHRVTVKSGGTRARGRVYTATTAAKRREARDRTLSKALDAGRN